MQELSKQVTELEAAIQAALKSLRVDTLEQELEELSRKTADPDVWKNQEKALALNKEQAGLEARIKPWREIEREVIDLKEMISMQDAALEAELQQKYSELSTQYSSLKKQLLFAGPYDDHNVILSVYSGAGGTDAQDWAQMLLRMYVRYAEKQGFDTKTVDQSDGEEAGIKSATLRITGPFAYGKLRGEHGVHRLVRLSPFNSDNLRQTSFAKVEVVPEIDKPEDVQIDEKDLKIDVYRSGGKGGQSVNTTDSAVRVTHLPTGLNVAIQNERSQLQNKETALTILRSKLAQLQLEQHAKDLRELKGPNEQAAWGNQIRSYVLHPYKQVKDLRTNYVTSDAEAVLDGGLQDFITAYLEQNIGDEK